MGLSDFRVEYKGFQALLDLSHRLLECADDEPSAPFAAQTNIMARRL
jgi:hypothetical protein